MDPGTTTIRQFLIDAYQRLPSYAVAFISPSLDDFQFHSSHRAEAQATSEMLRHTADTFLIQSRNRQEPLIRNRVRYENGGPLLGRFLVAPVTAGGELAGIVMLFRQVDDTEFTKDDARHAEQLSRQLSRALSLPADPVTGLLARAGVEKLVELRLASLGEGASSCVLYGDIDQLHVVNDLLGFETGDRAIAAVAKILATELSDDDAVLSRLSGDRFTVFLPGCALQQAQEIAGKLRQAVHARPLTLEDSTIPVSISFGGAPLRAGERSFDHALAAAEVACKTAKDRGRNRVEIYQVSDDSMIRRRDDVAIVGQLRSALDEGRYQIFGQPIASLLQPESIRRYEMLLRIVDEKGRLVLPSYFMSSATRYQLLPRIDRCVITQVLDSIKTARARQNFKPLHVSINLSGPTISDPEFLDWLLGRIEDSGVSGEWLTFELTETAAVSNVEQALVLMERLGTRGCRFALDDFGTGLSSLTHLKNMHFSSLKIDGSFIRDILHNERSQSLVRAVAQLASAMGMETVAEYVETPEVCMRLIELQVQFGQGYAIGKPRPFSGILNGYAASD